MGGDYKSVDDSTGNFAITSDGGETWDPLPKTGPTGFLSAVAYAPLRAGLVVAVGPAGSEVSTEGGLVWTRLAGPGFHAMGFDRSGKSCWAVGEDGRIAKFDPAVLHNPAK